MNPGSPERPLHHGTLALGAHPIATRHGEFVLHLFRDLPSSRIAMVLARGDLARRAPLLVRVHSSCVTSEALMARDCDCAEQLELSLARIDEAGRGAVVYLMQEGRGAGLSAKARDRMLVQASGNRLTTFEAYAAMGLPPDLRRYEVVASIFALLGVGGPVRLLTNNPDKLAIVARALDSEKIEIDGAEPVAGLRSPWNGDYLRAKRRAGHVLDHAGPPLPGARPPERVETFEPLALAADPSQLVTAAYALPIAVADETVWFRASVLVEQTTGRESIVLARGETRPPATSALPAAPDWIELSLLDRLPVPHAPGRAAVARALARIHAEGSGRVGVRWDETLLPARPGSIAGPSAMRSAGDGAG